ncbi:MAG: hypothetical protein DME04_21380 [Candidatus Rokuibacteriota bacterium]|nr:MAG: hypothetical protein DME04_21380 [Candidatus Rokubacteria bacterium]
MKLTFKRREVKSLHDLGTLVAENADAIEPGLQILSSSLNLGRTSVDLAAIDHTHTPVLVALALTADDALLVRALEAYAWCLEYPESVQRLVPANVQPNWPPRVVFVAERLLESFVRKLRLLKFSSVDCFEFRYIEVNGATGFYLDRVDWVTSTTSSQDDSDRPEPPASPFHEEPKAASLGPNGTKSRELGDSELSQVTLRGLRGPADEPKNRKWLDLLDTPAVPVKEPEVPTVAQAPKVERETPEPEPPAKSDGASRSELAPTWRKFLDKLTGTFEPRPAAPPPPEPPRPTPPPAPASPLVLQTYAAEIEVTAEDVAPDEPKETGLTEKQKMILKGLKLPDNGELAPQWRKFLDGPALDDSKISVVRAYLQREFPLSTVYDFHDFQRNAQVFQLQDNHGKVAQLITMTAEFFDAHRDLEIRAWIEKHKVAQAMRQAGQAGVLVTPAGLQIERR